MCNEVMSEQLTQTEAPNPVEPLLAQAKQHLQAGDFAGAAGAAGKALQRAPEDVEALYLLAVARRYGGDLAGALDAIGTLKRAAPDYGRAYQEEGHAARARGDDEAAREAYDAAVMRNPALTASWRALAELHRDKDAAARANAHAERLAALHPALVSVNSFIHENKLFKAERLCRDFLKKNPRDVEAMRLLAKLGVKLNVLDDAEFLLESALEFEPDFLLARIDYVEVLHKRQKYERALEEARAVLSADPVNPAFKTMVANQAAALGLYGEALALYQDVLSALPDNPHVHLARGHALKTIGRQGEAIEAYHEAAAAQPGFGDAYWSLANLKTYQFPDEELETVRAAEGAPGASDEDRIHLCFALGKAFEDRGAFEESFRYYQRGNALKNAQIRYDAERMDAELSRQKDVCKQELFAAKAGAGHDARDPIFIVGLPRAGSTLIEQILASHSEVDGTMELPNILATAHRLNGRQRIDEAPRYPAMLADLGAEKLEALGRAYIEDTRVHRRGAPFFTDKMPNNFRHIGLIHLILPNAKIIDARRDAMACCFSGYKQLFAEGQEFTYGLEEIGRYYRGYVELMAHWDRVLPGKVLRVSHEDVVDDLEAQVRRILDHCGLPFERACVEFHKTEREVRTASSEQVRQPIFKSGVEQWRRYEPWLGPLRDALGPALSPPDM